MSRYRSLVWSKDTYNSKPHCMANNKGNPRRLWDMNYHLDNEDSDGLCHEDHTANPKVIADVEWLRFIRTFGKVWEEDLGNSEKTNPFTDTYHSKEKRLVLHHYHDFYVEGHVYPYCEEYWMVKPNSTSEWALIFAIYLDNDKERSNISCFDADYLVACEATYDRVQHQYRLDSTVF